MRLWTYFFSSFFLGWSYWRYSHALLQDQVHSSPIHRKHGITLHLCVHSSQPRSASSYWQPCIRLMPRMLWWIKMRAMRWAPIESVLLCSLIRVNSSSRFWSCRTSHIFQTCICTLFSSIIHVFFFFLLSHPSVPEHAKWPTEQEKCPPFCAVKLKYAKP